MTNNQIPMTNENDNDQCTNNQLNKGKNRKACPYHFGYCLFLWLLEFGQLVIIRFIGHHPFHY